MAAKIMLVEDDTNLSEIYKARLEAEGYEIISAADGEEALALAVKERPDLILSDIMMPKISGFDMLDILRATPGVESTKVIMMTALGQSEDKSRAEKLGADRYLVKSQVTLEDVIKTIHEVLEGTSTDTSTAPADISPVPSQPTPTVATTPVVAPTTVATPTPQPITPEPASTVEPIPVATPTPQPTVTPTVPVVEPTVIAPVVQPVATAPAGPVIEPTTNNLSTSPPLDTTSTAAATNNASFIDPSLSQSSQEESSNISSQIQDFLNPTPTDNPTPNPSVISAPPLDSAAVPPSNPIPDQSASTPSVPDNPNYNFVNIANKKVVEPGPTKPHINSLLAKEDTPQAVPQTGQVITSDQPQNKDQIDPNSIAL
jgi:CheY-like chemotaxis protein